MYAIAEVGPESDVGFGPRGGALHLWRCRDHECIISGPSETGKTYSCLHKLDALLWKYPGSQAVILRKTLASLYTSVLRTYKTVLGPGTPVRFFGGEKPEWADYPNGSRVFFAGMDNPLKALSSERDFVYVNQAEELSLDDWEVLTTRCTGRAGNTPHPQILGDCNPGPPTHWILHRPSIRLIESRHEDNPTLFDDAGQVTGRGEVTLAILDRLTGTRKARLRFGKWVQAEGVVYEAFDRSVHVLPRARFDPTAIRRYVAGVDWGYTNPGVIGVWGVDGDGRMIGVAEVYRTRRLIGWWVDRARELHAAYGIEAFVCDPAEPAFIDEFRRAGLPAVAAFHDLKPGIQAVQERLAVAPDGRPRLMILEGALSERDEDLAGAKRPTCTLEEIDSYVWPKGQDGRAVKEVPVDDNNHGCDQMRYAACYVDGFGRNEASVAASPLAGWYGAPAAGSSPHARARPRAWEG